MVKDSARRLFDVVIVWKLDRFARNRYDSAHYKNVLRKNDVRVISAKENISEGPEGIILETMLEGMAEYYSAELSVKVKRGLKENALKALYAKENLVISIAQEEMQKPLMTRERVVYWISRFKSGNPKDEGFRQRLIDAFINSIYLYDDRIIINSNYKDGARTITLEEVEEAFGDWGMTGSDLTLCAPPRQRALPVPFVLAVE